MASRKSTIQVDVTGDARSAIKALGQVTAKMGTMQSKAIAVGSAIGTVIGKGVTAAIGAIRDLGGEILSQSDSIQKFQSTMGFAGFDDSAIKAATKATRDYADKTVYDLTTVQNTTAQLAANGVQDYVGLTKAAGNLNAVAGGNAETFKSVAMVLTQTAGAGKLTTENWNQLTDAIPGAADRLMESMKQAGAYTGNFRDAMEDGQISAQEFSDAIMSLGMEDVAQQAATSTATFEGAWGNLMASLTGGAADLVNIFKPAITNSIGWAAAQISTWFSIANQAIGDFLNAFTNTASFDAASQTFQAIVDAVKTVGDTIGTVAETIVPQLSGVGDAIQNLGGASGIGTAIGNAFNGAAGVVQTMAGAVKSFGDWVKANAEPISLALVTIGSGFAAFKVASIISTVVTMLKSFSAASTAAAIAQQLLNVAMNANPIMIVITAIGALVGALTWFFTQTETGRQIWANFTSFLGSCANNIVGFFQSLPGRIGGFFQSAVNAAQGAWSGVTGFFSGIWNGITSGARSIVGGIRNAFSSAVNAAEGVIEGLVSKVQSVWDRISGIIGSIKSGIQGAWDTITGLLPFSAAPMRANAIGFTPMAAAYAPRIAIGGADSQSASYGSPRPAFTLTDLATVLNTASGKTTVNYITYNVQLPARMMVGSKSELIRWIKQGLAEAERRVN